MEQVNYIKNVFQTENEEDISRRLTMLWAAAVNSMETRNVNIDAAMSLQNKTC